MKIALINPPVWALETPPLGITYLASFLKQNNFSVKCFDFNAELFHKQTEENKIYWTPSLSYKWKWQDSFDKEILLEIIGKQIGNWISRIVKETPQVVGITNHANPVTSLIASKIKQINPEIVIVAGGQLCSPSLGGQALHEDSNIDFISLGEGELAMLQLCQKIRDKLPLTNLKGFYKNESRISPELIENIDSLPFPDYSDIDLNKYAVLDPIQNGWKPSNSLSMLLSRGCVNNCDFCMQRVIWEKPFRCRSVENVISEMKFMIDKWGVKRFHFNDLLLNGNFSLLINLANAILQENLGIIWGGNLTIDNRFNLENVELLYSSGFDHAVFGVESGTQKVLNEMGKRYSPEEAERVLKLFNQPNMKVFINLIIGHPSETEEDFNQTLDFLRRTSKYLYSAPSPAMCAIFAGSDLLKKYQNKEGFNWNEPERWSYKENTWEERKRRLNKLIELTNKLFPSGFFMVDKDRNLD